MNAWRTPQRVVAADCPDQIADVGRDRRPADTTARLATPVLTEAAPMPAHQRLRLEDNRGFKQGGEQPIEPDEDQAICTAQLEPRRRGSLQHNKLLADAILASRAACDRNTPTSNPPSRFRRSIIPAMRVAHRGSCASPDAIFGNHRIKSNA